jgi:hypothetical protein
MVPRSHDNVALAFGRGDAPLLMFSLDQKDSPIQAGEGGIPPSWDLSTH